MKSSRYWSKGYYTWSTCGGDTQGLSELHSLLEKIIIRIIGSNRHRTWIGEKDLKFLTDHCIHRVCLYSPKRRSKNIIHACTVVVYNNRRIGNVT